MAHVDCSKLAKGLRLEGKLLQAMHPFRNAEILKAAGMGSVLFFKAIPVRLLGGETVKVSKPGGYVNVAVYKGKGYRKGNGPTVGVLWLHGGGFVMGGPTMIAMTIARKILNTLNCVMVVPDYTLAWKAPYPAAIDDCWATLLWMKEHTSELGITAPKFVVAGESAGGGLTAGLTLYARDHGFEDIGLQLPLYPMIDCLPTETNVDNDAPNWDSVANDLAWRMYLGEEPSEDVEPYASPSRETNYEGLPRTITLVGSVEPFNAEVKTYVENLRNAGVDVAFREFEGCFHAFDMMQPFAKVSRDATKWILTELKNGVR